MAQSIEQVPGKQRAARSRIVKPLAWGLAAIAAVLLFGLIDLATLVGWVNPAYEWNVPLEVSWGSFFTFVVAGSYVWIALRPHQPWPALVQLGIGAVSLTVSSVLSSDTRPMWVAVPLTGSVVLFAWLTSPVAGKLPRSRSLGWPHLLLAAAGGALWLPYAAHAFEQARLGTVDDITMGVGHWPVQGAVGLALLTGAVLMGVWDVAVPLFRVTLSLSATLIGAAMLAYPDRAGAMDGPIWGIMLVLWGTAVALPRRISQSAQVVR